jgi:3-oxoacyl-[acyl-carrier-protein] synthase II
MMGRRVAVTGLGLVSPHGDHPQSVFDALCRGESAIRLWDNNDVAPVVVASAQFDKSRWFTRLQLAGVDRVSQIAVAAAESARDDAGLAQWPDADRVGVYFGTGMGGAAAIEDAFRTFGASQRVPPLTVPAGMTNAAAAHVAMRAHIFGPVLTYSIACASSAVAIAQAAKAIALGDIDIALAGGSEALLVPGVVRAWQALQTLATPDASYPETSCRPFSSDRSGLVLGEGSAFMVLEALDQARSRGARIYAEFAGSGISCDATHLTKPDASGQVKALQMALRTSGLAADDISYCNAHGTATRAGDVVECDALRAVFGDAPAHLTVGSTKSMHGHLLGGAGALEALITVMAVHRKTIPANANCVSPDPQCDVPLAGPTGSAAPHMHAALSNSFAFGGTNAVLVFRQES